MKQKATSKLLRAVLIAAVLVIALVSGGVLDKSGCVNAKTCDEAMNDYFNADSTYEIARVSFFYNQPTTCQEACQSSQDPNCVQNCHITRETALQDAGNRLFAASFETCTPIGIDQCDAARAMAEECIGAHPYLSYENIDERIAVFNQYSACRSASKVDSCQ